MELKLTETNKENLFIINDYIDNLKEHLKLCEKYKNDSQVLLTNATFIRMYSNELIKYMIDRCANCQSIRNDIDENKKLTGTFTCAAKFKKIENPNEDTCDRFYNEQLSF